MMLFMFVINLLETSYSFRMIDLNVLPLEPSFSEESVLLNIIIKNTSDLHSGPLWIRLNGREGWTEINPIEANASQIVSLQTVYQDPGIQAVPKIRIKAYADSGLYRFWRVIDPKMNAIVLPKPIDHKVLVSLERSFSEDNDLSGFEEIRDPSRFMYTDLKLLQKTNRRYQRSYHSRRFSTQLSYRWVDLNKLPEQQKGEQFSFWLKSISVLKNKQDCTINVETPFIQLQSPAYMLDLASLKSSFAKWFYA